MSTHVIAAVWCFSVAAIVTLGAFLLPRASRREWTQAELDAFLVDGAQQRDESIEKADDLGAAS